MQNDRNQIQNKLLDTRLQESDTRQSIMKQKQQQAAQQQAQFEAFLKTLPPEQQAIARLDPEGFVKQQTKMMFPDAPKENKRNAECKFLFPNDPAKQQAYVQSVTMKPNSTTNVNVNSGPKLPNNYMWQDPNNPSSGVIPIPGSEAESNTPK